MEKKQLKHKYIWNITEFNELNPNDYGPNDHVLGNFIKFEFKNIKNPCKNIIYNEKMKNAFLTRRSPTPYRGFTSSLTTDRF